VIFSVLIAVFVALFSLTLLTFTTSLFDAPSEEINQFDLLIASFNIAASLWLLANGVHTDLLGSDFGYIPLGLSLLIFALIYFSLKPRKQTSIKAVFVGSLSYVGMVVLVYALGSHTGNLAIFISLVKSFTLAFIALTFANTSGSFFAKMKVLRSQNVWLKKLPKYVTKSLQYAIVMVGIFLIMACLLTLVGVIININASQIIFDRLNASPATAVLISLYTVFFLPNFIIYNLSFILGHGFAFGDLAYFSLHVQNDTSSNLNAIPPLPILGGILQSSQLSIPRLVPYVLLIVLGVTASVMIARETRLEYTFPAFTKMKLCLSQALHLLICCAFLALFCALGVLTLGYISSGFLLHGFGFVGVASVSLALKVGVVVFLADIPVVLAYAVYKATTLKLYEHGAQHDDDDSAIIMLRRETKTSLKKEIQHEMAAKGHRAKGNRSVSSTYKKP
jgi:hypothetical protein